MAAAKRCRKARPDAVPHSRKTRCALRLARPWTQAGKPRSVFSRCCHQSRVSGGGLYGPFAAPHPAPLTSAFLSLAGAVMPAKGPLQSVQVFGRKVRARVAAARTLLALRPRPRLIAMAALCSRLGAAAPAASHSAAGSGRARRVGPRRLGLLGRPRVALCGGSGAWWRHCKGGSPDTLHRSSFGGLVTPSTAWIAIGGVRWPY